MYEYVTIGDHVRRVTAGLADFAYTIQFIHL